MSSEEETTLTEQNGIPLRTMMTKRPIHAPRGVGLILKNVPTPVVPTAAPPRDPELPRYSTAIKNHAVVAASPRNSRQIVMRNPGVLSPDPSLPPPPPDENDETDDELVDAWGYGDMAAKKVWLVKPTKAQILLYFSAAANYRLKRAGGDLQVTDPDDFPLFDVWLDMDCCRCTWVIEAYGRVVMLLHEETGSSIDCVNGSRRPILVTDWNSDIFGYLVPGDPFLLQSPDKQTVAKLIPHSPNPVSGDSGHNSQSSGSLFKLQSVDSNKRMCWLCVLEGSGRHIARLDDFDTIRFNKDVAFQLKLLALAGIIRLSAPWMMPGRGESTHMMGCCSRFFSGLLNCCAYCFY